MKILVIVRHGEFSRSYSQVADVDHPLNRHGHHQVDEMARQFVALDIVPDLLVSSTAVRAIETAQAYAKTLNISPESIRIEEDIFEAERAEILRIVHSLDDAAQTVILFGHHPGVTNLLHHLTDGGVEKMPLGSFVVLEFAAENWRAVSFKKGTLVNYSESKKKKKNYGLWWRFTFWRRQRVQKIELFVVFLVGLLLILGVVALIVMFSTDPVGMPQQGSMGR